MAYLDFSEVLQSIRPRCLALLWQIKGAACAVGFPNRVFNDSWVVGFWRADHGRHDVGLGRRAWALAQAIPGSLGPQGAATDVSALRGGADRPRRSQERSADGGAACAWRL